MILNTRNKILSVLSRNHSASAQEISQELNLTKADIQYHLNKMTAEGFTEISLDVQSAQNRRGRPTLYYSLTSKNRPNNYMLLCHTTLKYLFSQIYTDEKKQNLINDLAKMMLSPEPTSSPAQALRKVVKTLNKHNYQAGWEARKTGPRIFFNNCPYLGLIAEHSELCKLDTLLLENLLQVKVHQTGRITPGTNSSQICSFVISEPL